MRYLKNSSGYTHIFEVVYLNGMCANVPRCTIPLYIQDVSEKSKMAAGKPEVLITRKLFEVSEKFQRLHQGFQGRLTDWDYSQHCSTSAVLRYRQFQAFSKWKAAILNFRALDDIGQCRL